MGIERTDAWLKEDWRRPEDMCRRLQDYFPGKNTGMIYKELASYGMYRPYPGAEADIEQLIENRIWETVGAMFRKYKAKWNGPDVPVFIFPAAKQGGMFKRAATLKSGVSYPDKLFLFLPSVEDQKEIEALYVHEYHHTSRMNAIGKDIKDYTLLDSMVMEGLAEYAVNKECGRQYLGKWCSRYTDGELEYFWKELLQDNLDEKINGKTHDRLLYGGHGIPKLLGYCAGYWLVKKYYESRSFSPKESFNIAKDVFLK